jgi:peptidoglycan/LPS O-acetylase OafA/YrhL
VLFQLYLLYPLVAWLYKRYGLKFLGASFLIQYIWSFIRIDNTEFPLFLSHLFWFVLGLAVLEKREKILGLIDFKRGVVLVLLVNIVRSLPYYYEMRNFEGAAPMWYFFPNRAIEPFFFLMEIILLYKAALYIVEKKTKCSTALGKIAENSLEIYLIHAIVIAETDKIVSGIGLKCNTPLYYPVMWLLTLSLSLGFAVLYRKGIKN